MSGVTGQAPVEVDHRPTRVSASIATVGALVAVALTAPFVLLAAPFSLGGGSLLLVGLHHSESRSQVTLGTAGLLAGVIVAAGYGSPPTVLLPAAIGAFVAWDVGQYAIEMGRMIGRQGHTRRAELLHAGASALIGVLVAAIGYGVYSLAGSGQPAPALALLLVGAVLLMWTTRQ